MDNKQSIQLFEDKRIRTAWDEEAEEWYFSIVDVVAVLTDSANPTDYLKKMRKRDVELGNYIGTNCPHVEMLAWRIRQEAQGFSGRYRTASTHCPIHSIIQSRTVQAMACRCRQRPHRGNNRRRFRQAIKRLLPLCTAYILHEHSEKLFRIGTIWQRIPGNLIEIGTIPHPPTSLQTVTDGMFHRSGRYVEFISNRRIEPIGDGKQHCWVIRRHFYCV